ncbi:MAG TPA: DUF5655 domain-containing protein [Actinomycetota bacterium]|nr:DUF5655 domain-containing protein [Actinomycetota bacterium]
MRPEELFDGHPQAREVVDRVRSVLAAMPGTRPVEVRTTKSQVAFRRSRGFAFVWRPGQYLRGPASEVVLSIALGRRDTSPRFKEVVHPSPAVWMHHLELESPDDVDDEVVGWLREAADAAG